MSNIKYLIIDDHAVDALITYKLIKGWLPKFEHVHMYNGTEALEYLADKQTLFPKLIIIDIEMPIMGGFEFLGEYEKEYFDNFPNTIIIVLTSSINPRDKNEALSFKCVNGFLIKPITKEKFSNMVKSFI